MYTQSEVTNARTIRRPVKLIMLALMGVALGLLVAEGVLRVSGYPRFYKAHSSPPQFAFIPTSPTNFIYVNTPSSSIRFVYDGNPRGYFGEINEVDHVINAAGFRGPDFTKTKPPRTLRIAFLGDSFTFGEGVRFEDTYSERTAAILSARLAAQGATCESYNFGVGGYNTDQELYALRNFALLTDPDVVVIGYTLNDPEPVLFGFDPVQGVPVRRARERDIPEGLGDALPPETILYRSRVAQFLWQKHVKRTLTLQTVTYYRDLFAADNPGWQESRQALRAIVATCQSRRIPCIVLIFPILYQLNDRYPFMDMHRMIEREVLLAGGTSIDLFPLLKGRPAAALWVHPTDPHPNEIVHAIAAEALAARIAKTEPFQERLNK